MEVFGDDCLPSSKAGVQVVTAVPRRVRAQARQKSICEASPNHALLNHEPWTMWISSQEAPLCSTDDHSAAFGTEAQVQALLRPVPKACFFHVRTRRKPSRQLQRATVGFLG